MGKSKSFQSHDGIAFLAHAVNLIEFIEEAKPLEALHDVDSLAKPIGANAPIEDSGIVADANHVGISTAAPRVGFIRDGGNDLIVIGERRYAVEQLCIHGFLADSDAQILRYLAKYLAKIDAMDVLRAGVHTA
jgi:hypothetical protein